jgi:hypothetical protein
MQPVNATPQKAPEAGVPPAAKSALKGDPITDKTDALRMLKFINYAWTPYHVVGAL